MRLKIFRIRSEITLEGSFESKQKNCDFSGSVAFRRSVEKGKED
jgi:hypothetical protein